MRVTLPNSACTPSRKR